MTAKKPYKPTAIPIKRLLCTLESGLIADLLSGDIPAPDSIGVNEA